MARWRWLTAVGGCTAAAVVGAWLHHLAAHGLVPCREDITAEDPSPNGKMIALTITSNCGATTDFATLVGIVAADRPHKLNDNYFFATTGVWRVPIHWINNDHLVVTVTTNEMILRKAVVSERKQIRYD